MRRCLMTSLAALLLVSWPLAVPSLAQAPSAFVSGAEALTESDCAGDVAIVVGSDANAQSDIYSAVTLAGVVGTDCIVLAGHRGADMPADQRVRLDSAADSGYVLGGHAAVPATKLAGRNLKRIGGADRWATAYLVGIEAITLAGGSSPALADGSRPPAGTTPHPSAAISAGYVHTCGLRTNTTVTCWGDDTFGQTAAPPGSYTAVTAGGAHTCALHTNTTVTCWGDDTLGQTAAPPGSYTAVTAGSAHTCALHTNTTVTCWGAEGRQTAAPPGSYTAVTAGDWHTCALHTNTTVTCWGDDTLGQTAAPPGSYTAVTAGSAHTCALHTNTTVTCWGAEGRQTVAPPGSYTAVTAGDWHTCALHTDTTVTCWGDDTFGQTAAPPGSYTAVTAGGAHTCALHTNITVTCWGAEGRYADGTSVDAGQATAPSGTFGAAATPLPVPGMFVNGAEPWIASDCTGDTPIVVSADATAQSDIYSAIVLAGVLGTDCIVLAGARHDTFPASQTARLDSAAQPGYVLGGHAAVPAMKVAGRNLKRIGGADRWATAQLVGSEARMLAQYSGG